MGCGRVVFNRDVGKLAAPRSATTRRCSRYVLRRLMIDRTAVSAIAVELGQHDYSTGRGSISDRAGQLAEFSTADVAQTGHVIAMNGFAGYKTEAAQVMS
jgi:hypothetical protein